MAEMGRLLVIVGVALVVVGGIVMLLGRTGLPLGRLPGDILYRGKNTTFYFPLASSILISVSAFNSAVSDWAHAAVGTAEALPKRPSSFRIPVKYTRLNLPEEITFPHYLS
jgi:Protein of unknown function (DUF2905)